MREAIHIRYSLLPYYYTLFREAATSGIPILRPLWLEFPADKETYDNGEAFMVGSSLLVQGVYEKVYMFHTYVSCIFMSWLGNQFLSFFHFFLLLDRIKSHYQFICLLGHLGLV